MALEQKIKRQAVIVIHGIGEQPPMETLRSFVNGIKSGLEEDDIEEKEARLRSKADSIGNIYETVRLSMSKTNKRPITDFYEFYWAHNMRDTEFSHMWTWIFRLVFTSVKKIPPRLKKLWWTVWILFLVVMTTVLILSNKDSLLAPIVTLFAFPFLLSALGSFTKKIFLDYAGDAARYFTPNPNNICERSNIRQQGMEFLKKLHTIEENEKVDRIIIVAHSLGTVIAYDLMRLLWMEYNTVFNQQKHLEQPFLQKIDDFKISDTNLEDFQKLQYATWNEQKVIGNPWLISDFITLGAAINAADYFMVTKVDFNTLIKQREMPVCPPEKDKDDKSFIYKSKSYWIKDDEESKTVKLLNHGALFAVTRWTNIYFLCDYVGGPMQRRFGNGIKDIYIKKKSLWFYPGGHTDYWNWDNSRASKEAVKEIIKAMNLNW